MMDTSRTEGRAGSLPRRIAKSPERWLKKLRRWKSLPTSQLAPPNRPLFTCRRCAASNTHGIICTWCGHTECDRLPGIRVMRRRVSAPQPLNDLQKEQLRKVQQYATTMCVTRDIPIAPASEPRLPRRKRNRDAAVFSIDGVTGLMRTHRDTKFLVRSIIPQGADVSPPQSPTFAISRGPSSTGQSSEGNADSVKVPLPTPSPPRTLRRRKRFSLPKRLSSCSLRSKAPDPNVSIISFPSPGVHSKTPARAQDATIPSAPSSPTRSARSATSSRRGCGYPNQPLYNSIRPGFSATNLNVTALSIRSVSPCGERSTSPLCFSEDEELDDVFSQMSVPYTRGHVRSTSGCSLSGETELRMELSRRRRNTVGGPEYKPQLDGSGKQGPSFMLTVKKISNGLKSLVKSRS